MIGLFPSIQIQRNINFDRYTVGKTVPSHVIYLYRDYVNNSGRYSPYSYDGIMIVYIFELRISPTVFTINVHN